MHTYTAIYYYEALPGKESDPAIHVFFPDLSRAGLPAMTSGEDREDAREAAEDFLAVALDMAKDEGKQLPDPEPIERTDLSLFYSEMPVRPFRIEVEQITV